MFGGFQITTNNSYRGKQLVVSPGFKVVTFDAIVRPTQATQTNVLLLFVEHKPCLEWTAPIDCQAVEHFYNLIVFVLMHMDKESIIY